MDSNESKAYCYTVHTTPVEHPFPINLPLWRRSLSLLAVYPVPNATIKSPPRVCMAYTKHIFRYTLDTWRLEYFP